MLRQNMKLRFQNAEPKAVYFSAFPTAYRVCNHNFPEL
jgi:hypothetical protein